jgi:hypothetical protein
MTGLPSSTRYELGVLFVHGIGEQQQGSTLLKWGASVVSWLDRWLTKPPSQPGQEPPVEIFSIDPRPASPDVPAHGEVVLSLPDAAAPHGDRQQWLLAESWWASVIKPPRFGQLARWAVPMTPWLAYEYAVAAGTTQDPCPPEPPRQGSPRWGNSSKRHGLGLLIPPVALVLMAFVLLLDLLQRLPLVGSFATRLVGKFEQGVGDAYLFCLDGPARGAMKQRISRDLNWLQQRCDRVVVVAHSQGAALTHDVLAGTAKLRPGRAVDLFVTVGSGVRRLYNMRRLYSDQRLLTLGWLGVLAAVAATAGLLVAGIGLAAGIGQAAVGAGAMLVALGLGAHAWVHRAISTEVDRPLPDLALPRSSTAAWRDYYATADPVPNGPIHTDARDPNRIDVQSCVVHNYRSLSKDHSGYVDNTDQVLTWLAQDFVTVAGSALGPGLTETVVRQGWRRRRWRTLCRSFARNLLLAIGGAAAVLLTLPAAAGSGWWRLGRRLGANPADYGQPAAALLSIKAWIEERPLLGLQSLVKAIGPETFVGVAVALIVVVVSAGWLGWRWSRWDAGDINHLFASNGRSSPSMMPRTAWTFWSIITLFVLGSGAVAASYGPLQGGWRTILWLAVLASLGVTGWLLRSLWRTYFRQADQHQTQDIGAELVDAARGSP